MQLDEPGQKDTPEAPKAAAARLEAMGPMTVPQKVMAATLGGAVVLWMFGDLLGVSAVVAAMMGLTVLLTTGVLEWDDCLGYKPAWDTLTWCAFSGPWTSVALACRVTYRWLPHSPGTPSPGACAVHAVAFIFLLSLFRSSCDLIYAWCNLTHAHAAERVLCMLRLPVSP